MTENFKENGFMIMLGILVAVFVIGQSLFFLVKAWKEGRRLGISSKTLKNTVISSSIFTIAPAVSILATVIALANALGLVLPWIRLTVIGNVAYETSAAQATLDVFSASLSGEITDPKLFAAIAGVMTAGSVLPLILIIFLMKRVQKTVGKAASKNSKLAGIMSAAAFIGIVAAFVSRSIAGAGKAGENPLYGFEFGDGAGVMSVCTLVCAMLVMTLLSYISKKFSIKWLDTFSLPISMFAAMITAAMLAHFMPAEIAFLEWRG